MSSHCHTCECPVPEANLNQHACGEKHRQLEIHSTKKLTWCPLCSCDVSRSAFIDHVLGEEHEENVNRSLWTRVSRIQYSQDSIAPHFTDGTTLDDGIDNVADGMKYPLEVGYVNGQLVALNNRTLYCYKVARIRFVTVLFARDGLKQRRAWGYNIKVRGG